MRATLLFFMLVLSCFPGFAQPGKRIYLQKGGDNGVILNKGMNFQPGDTLVIRSSMNPWSYIAMDSIIGSAQRPIVIINEGAVELTAGFDFFNSQYIKLTGSGSKERYGFSIRHSSGVGISIHGKCAHLETERFFAEECAFGVWIKNEADCDTSINSWVLNDMSVHDYQLKNMRIEGFYMGSTDPNNVGRPIMCNGKQVFYRPSKLGNIKVYNGIIDGTGRPAIMLCNAQYGVSEIYNNVVSNVGREYNDQQGTGISIGMYTRVYVHHNTVKNTYTWGIASLGGSGLVRIENNHVDSSGYLDGRTLAWPQNIVVDTRQTDPVDSTRFIVVNNKVDHPGSQSHNIEIWKTVDSYFSSGNIICHNTSNGKPADLKLAPGIRWNNCRTPQVSKEENKSMLLIGGIIGGGLILILILGVLVARRKKAGHRLQKPSLA